MGHAAKLPDLLPGKYFVLEYDRLMETFQLTVDNETHDSFVLGSAITCGVYFKRLGLLELGEAAVATAKSFGKSQAVIGTTRVIPIFSRTPPKKDLFAEVEGDSPAVNARLYQ